MKIVARILAPVALTAVLIGAAHAQAPKPDIASLTWLAGTRYIARRDGSKSYETWTGPTMGVVSGAVASANGGMSEFFRIGPNEKGVVGMTSANTNAGLTTWKFRPLQSIAPGKVVFADESGSFSIERAPGGAIHNVAMGLRDGKMVQTGEWLWLAMPTEGAK